MLSKNLLKSSSVMGNTYLNKMVSSAAAVPSREFSIAFNVRSKFEAAFQKKQQSSTQATRKEYVCILKKSINNY